jgi:hypothetical protein
VSISRSLSLSRERVRVRAAAIYDVVSPASKPLRRYYSDFSDDSRVISKMTPYTKASDCAAAGDIPHTQKTLAPFLLDVGFFADALPDGFRVIPMDPAPSL